jgi:hypothetical protein
MSIGTHRSNERDRHVVAYAERERERGANASYRIGVKRAQGAGSRRRTSGAGERRRSAGWAMRALCLLALAALVLALGYWVWTTVAHKRMVKEAAERPQPATSSPLVTPQAVKSRHQTSPSGR